ncbi:hypothetical protein G6F59_016669 [Rhizopus arrhizus]|nr:hypothetical protein G6F59_016669 [Rhizopus arrhizus]
MLGGVAAPRRNMPVGYRARNSAAFSASRPETPACRLATASQPSTCVTTPLRSPIAAPSVEAANVWASAGEPTRTSARFAVQVKAAVTRPSVWIRTILPSLETSNPLGDSAETRPARICGRLVVAPVV